MMHPLIIVLIAYSTLMCSHVSGLTGEHRAAYDRVAECIRLGTSANIPEEHPTVAILMCDALKVRVK